MDRSFEYMLANVRPIRTNRQIPVAANDDQPATPRANVFVAPAAPRANVRRSLLAAFDAATRPRPVVVAVTPAASMMLPVARLVTDLLFCQALMFARNGA
jgi:hypothetical protein